MESVGAGSHYLADGTYTNRGTRNINATLLADLKHRTTYPPVLLTSDFAVSTTLSPQAQRDIDNPDLGYHYDPIDYCLSGLNLTNCTLTLTNGVAVGFYGTNGITLQSGAKFVSEGTALNLNRLVPYRSVQEQPIFWGASTNNLKMFPIASYPAVLPELRLRFTHIPFLAVIAYKHLIFDTSSGLAQFAMNDCQVQGPWLSFATYGYGPMTAGLTNNLIERSRFWLIDGTGSVTPFSVNLRNNLIFGGIPTLVIGDLAQLPPVCPSQVFRSPIWKKIFPLFLTTPPRDKNRKFVS